ncbi:tRNA glutamyl-Q(34) synthetase GluQRS [Mesorhizobium sp. M4B.F.Ca.ET.215.01.1.1]|uniref:tRNA glutamyl-Q(34) synthetase GluQRS n=1 Tax=Mesorhizobium abyssinicae TaxID=1209958 RepID=A0ABU5AL88_9HYPH|nr:MULTISPECIES: tRNA glutamyl-Q(34) synthetase GluQRS [Mesorhizobium]MDX8538024.1 tRNA glutamyl-Q(34) synthetase GluQRS [Mesorhizobium abyssinicae]RUW23348.1 tRNA glutamyl-Q(34) synthetase GluQRS [Mesorhizobium sp. M4B.F.Ca.ET.013.02.1.1]RVD40436.1 tRNA glutamyl-Q(34) synthetase GluQRS [Mesorhizobium sp. M4B.F.Ca.ET.019.03.1.1]RWF64233.1 MAG: tRNA glutamyl-Q(34) synthetase GluQRS [Mesorhizobium sp.]RWX69659.1 tRNA glutamyl-Q(34) synthetase GluQRS [Mesorhizobium sp. M4B.F.Ca.ET.089.01.1.1]
MTLLTFRFAPSPNGDLHLGHAYSALLNQRLAETAGGRLLLRIEDIDTTRCTPEFEAGIYRDLEWLGLEWERPVRRQSDHFAEYQAVLDRLVGEELVYPAFMSRGEIRAYIADSDKRGRDWPRDPDGVPLYPAMDKALPISERKRRIAENAPFAWRLDIEKAMARVSSDLSWTEFSDATLGARRRIEARPRDWGDVILARRDIPTSYHLAVVVDDALQGISQVVRGQDLFLATSVQRLLQDLLGLDQPAYFHHRLILGPDGRKLSKSLGDTGLAALRQAGASPDDVRRLVGL